jgi:hypothetical protein
MSAPKNNGKSVKAGEHADQPARADRPPEHGGQMSEGLPPGGSDPHELHGQTRTGRSPSADSTWSPDSSEQLNASTSQLKPRPPPVTRESDTGWVAWYLLFAIVVAVAVVFVLRGKRGSWVDRGRRKRARDRELLLPDPVTEKRSVLTPHPAASFVHMKSDPDAGRSHAPKQLVSPGLESVPSAEALPLKRDVGEILHLLREHARWHESVVQHLYSRLDEIATRVAAPGWSPGVERAVASRHPTPPATPVDLPPARGHDSLEGRMLQMWNDVDWEHGAPSLSAVEQMLRDERYDLVEGIVGTYALAVPHRGDDARAPVYVLPFLGKANSHYDDSLFDRPQHGDSARVSAAAKVQFVDRGGARAASLERLKAGNERLTQVFTVVEPGRIE